MAIAHVAARHNSNVTAVGNSTGLDMGSASGITVGNHLILSMALDNSGTSGVDPNTERISDPRGNTWFRLGKATRDPGLANEGAHVEIWFTRVVQAYTNGDDITPVFSFPVARGAFGIREFSGIRPVSYSVDAVTATGSATTIGPGNITAEIGQLVISAAAIETNTAITGDSDTTNGSWSAISTDASNSGTDATSMTLSRQYKIVTGTGTQNWAVTKTGAADYAAISVVLDTYTSVAPTFHSGNPNYTCIAGPENLTNGSKVLPLDTGTAYMFTHKIFPNDIGSQDYAFVASVGVTASTETDPVSNHTIVGDVYLAGNETPTRDIVNTASFVVNTATLIGGAQVWNPETSSAGAGTALAAVTTVGGECVRIDAGQSLAVAFDANIVANFFPEHRILRWGIRYLAFKDDSEAPGPTNGMNVYIYDGTIYGGASGNYLAGGWLVNNYRGSSQYETRWFGEVNANPRAFRQDPLSVSDLYKEACWTPADFVNISGGAMWVTLEGSVSEFFLDYVQGVVELAPERREAHGARTISTAPYSGSIYPTGNLISRVVAAADSSQRWFVEDTDSEYVLVIREALPASPSDLYPALVEMDGGDRVVAPLEAIGPAAQLTALVGPRPTLSPNPTIRTGILSRGVLQETPEEEQTVQGVSVAAMDAINYPIEGTFFPSYSLSVLSGGQVSQVFSGNDLNQYIVVPGGQAYTRIKLFVSRDELTTDDLTISVEKPPATPIASATVTVADVDALPDDGRGFVEISVPLDVTITPTAGRVYVVLSSSAEHPTAWSVGGAIPAFNYSGYDVSSPTFSTEPYDYSVVLQCALAAPTYSLGTVTEDIENGERCSVVTTDLPTITLTNGATFDHIAIYRSADGGDDFPVALLDDPTNNQVFTDYEVPWDYPSGTITYTLIGHRDVDHLTSTTTTTAWTGTSVAPSAAFGLFSNELEAGFAYVESDQREVVTEYSPLSSVQMVQRHGVDYQVALTSPEERGLSVTVNVVVAQVAFCCDDESPALTSSKSMATAPFDALRSLERNRRMLLKLPGGETRFVYAKVGGMTVRTQHGVYMAQLTLTDVEVGSLDPWS